MSDLPATFMGRTVAHEPVHGGHRAQMVWATDLSQNRCEVTPASHEVSRFFSPVQRKGTQTWRPTAA
jgi:hypothetical protein